MTDDNDKTDPRIVPPRSDDAALVAAAHSLGRAADACRTGLELVVKVPPEHRGSALRSIVLLLGELGDLAYDMRRVASHLRDEHYGLG